VKYLFTYGTLMSGQCRNSVLTYCGAQLLGEVTLTGIKLYDYMNSFPVALLDKDGSITGEVYAIYDGTWEYLRPVLDQIESRGIMYDLCAIPLEEEREMYAYIGVKEYWEDAPLTAIEGDSPKWGE